MAGNGLPKEVRRRLYSFSRKVASEFSDSRRRRFIEDMIAGFVIGGHVHLSQIARAISRGDTDIHGVAKRLSKNLAREHWDMTPVADRLLAESAAMVDDDTILV